MANKGAGLTTEQKRALLKQLWNQKRGALATDAPHARMRARTPEDPLPMSYAQERLYLQDQLHPNRSTFNVPILHRVSLALDPQRLERSLSRVVARHEALRTSFELTSGGPVQRILPANLVASPLVNVVNVQAAADPEQAVAQLVQADIQQPFDLTQAPLIRASMFRLAADHSLVLLVTHHLISDRRSIQILKEELLECLLADLSGREPDLPPLPLQPADVALWERERSSSPRFEQLRRYWSEALNDAQELQLVAPISGTSTGEGGHESGMLDANEVSRLKSLAAARGATPFMLLHAAFVRRLATDTRQVDLVVATPVSERRHHGTENLIGLFVNTLPLRVRLEVGECFGDLLDRVREQCLAAYEHQDLPFDQLVKSASMPPDSLTRAIVQFHRLETRERAVPGVDAAFVHWGRAKFEWDICFTELPSGQWRLDFEYNAAHFKPASVRAFIQAFLDDLRRVTLESVFELPTTIPAGLNSPSAHAPSALPVRSVHAIFHDRALETPAAIALDDGALRTTYAELDERSSRIGGAILAAGVAPGGFIGVIVERGQGTVAAMLGVLKAGCAYVPLDPRDPADRLSFVANDAQLALIIGEPRRPVDFGRPIIAVNDLVARGSEDSPDLPAMVSPDSAAYVMYTSGSSGQPKGVVVTHQGIVRLFFGQSYATFGPGETFLQMAPLSFDASTFELWGALLHGGRVVLETGRIPSATELGEILTGHKVTTAWLTASLFNLLVDQDVTALEPLTQLVVGGETLSVPHVRKALEALPRTRLVNGYGPTETTVFACCYSIPRELPPSVESISLGQPIAHTQAIVVDDRGQLQPPGVAGELWIGGPGVAHGYLRLPELTSKTFVTRMDGTRWFRTGDLVRMADNETFEFLGRLDQQVKIRGFRVEPGDIEAALLRHPAVRQASVVAAARESAPAQLVAHVAGRGGLDLDPAALRTFVAERLPSYMVPAFVVIHPELPLTPNGKVDRAALGAAREPAGVAANALLGADPVEVRLLQIWCEILGVSEVSLDTDFFASGGDSLSALRLAGKIRQAFGAGVELAALYDATTIRRQAQLVRAGGRGSTCWIVRPGASGAPPVFCVGAHRVWLRVADRLTGTRPMIGVDFNVREGITGEDPIVALARGVVTSIRTCQPCGPYTLAGWSLSGLIAFEAAQQLRRDGESVALVVMVDTFPPLPERGLSRLGVLRTRLQMELGSAYAHARRFLRHPKQIADAPSSLYGLFRRWVAPPIRLPADPSDGQGQDLMTHETLNRFIVAASYQYRIEPYGGRVLFCTPTDRPPGWNFAPVWKRLVAGGFEELRLPGDHQSMFEQPTIQQLADRLASADACPSAAIR